MSRSSNTAELASVRWQVIFAVIAAVAVALAVFVQAGPGAGLGAIVVFLGIAIFVWAIEDENDRIGMTIAGVAVIVVGVIIGVASVG